ACSRTVRATNGLRRYLETVEGAPGGLCVIEPFDASVTLPSDVQLDLSGVTRYTVQGGVFRTLQAARSLDGNSASAFAHIKLMSRYASHRTRLELRGLGALAKSAFASATDLGTGLEQPLKVTRTEDGVVAEQFDCLARTLLRIYWPLE